MVGAELLTIICIFCPLDFQVILEGTLVQLNLRKIAETKHQPLSVFHQRLCQLINMNYDPVGEREIPNFLGLASCLLMAPLGSLIKKQEQNPCVVTPSFVQYIITIFSAIQGKITAEDSMPFSGLFTVLPTIFCFCCYSLLICFHALPREML